MTLVWVTIKDFKQLVSFKKRGLLGRNTKVPCPNDQNCCFESGLLIYALAIPIMVVDVPAWQLYWALSPCISLLDCDGSIFQLAQEAQC